MTCLRTAFASILASATVCTVGCYGSAPSVDGTVKWNGKSVENGVILFIGSSRPGEPARDAVLTIKDGNYSSDSTMFPGPGPNRVEIRAQKGTGKTKTVPKPDAPIRSKETITFEVTYQYIPPQYNSQSTLTREIKNGRNTFDFELEGEELPDKSR